MTLTDTEIRKYKATGKDYQKAKAGASADNQRSRGQVFHSAPAIF